MSSMIPPRVLFVCTANMNRSPTAAAWANKLFAERFVTAQIRSAGTHAWDGGPASANATQAMAELDFDLRTHRSQPIRAELLDWADHVVVMEPMHRDVILESAPEYADKILPMWDFIEDGGDHVVDPQGHEYEAFRRSAAEIGEATAKLVVHILAERRARRRAARG